MELNLDVKLMIGREYYIVPNDLSNSYLVF
jgi:hypothetical protein